MNIDNTLELVIEISMRPILFAKYISYKIATRKKKDFSLRHHCDKNSATINQRTRKILTLHRRIIILLVTCRAVFCSLPKTKRKWLYGKCHKYLLVLLLVRVESQPVRMISFRWQANKSHTIWKWNEMAYINGLHYFLLNW